MPKIRRSRKTPPEGWELIEPTLEVKKTFPGVHELFVPGSVSDPNP